VSVGEGSCGKRYFVAVGRIAGSRGLTMSVGPEIQFDGTKVLIFLEAELSTLVA